MTNMRRLCERPDPMTMPVSPVADHAPPQGGDEFGRVEVRGIDRIPESERHGHPRELFMLWASSNVTWLYVVLGGAIMTMGLSLMQAALAIVVGNLWWFVVGLIAGSGPAAGTPSYVVMRAIYGIRANRVNVVVSGWVVCVGWGAINLSVGSLATDQLLGWLGLEPTMALRLVVVAATAALTLTISIYGHATMVRCAGPFTAVLALCFAALALAVLPRLEWHALLRPGTGGLAAWSTAVALIASNPLSWTSSADFARYLPPQTRLREVLLWTALGGFIPAVSLCLLGALAGTVVDMHDAQGAITSLLPAWLAPVLLGFIALSSITNNIMTAYSSGLALQAAGVRVRRSLTVLADGALAFGGTVYALFVSHFLEALQDFLSLSVTLLAPGMAIYAADLILRHNRYDGPALDAAARGGRYWYVAGISPAGVIAQVAGTLVSLLAIVGNLWTGPLARASGGADLSWLAGPVVAVAVYALLFKRSDA